MTTHEPQEAPQEQPTHRGPSWNAVIAAATVSIIALALIFVQPWDDDSDPVTVSDRTPATVSPTPPSDTPTTKPGKGLANFVPRVLAQGEEVTAIAGTCIEGDVTVILTSGTRPVFDDQRDTGHLTCFYTDTKVVSTYASHISAATVEEHQRQMLTGADQCYTGSGGCPRVHVLVVENGQIVQDYWVTR